MELDKTKLFNAAARPTSTVQVDGYGDVLVEALTLAQNIQLVDRNREDPAAALAWVVCNGVVGLSQDDMDSVAGMDVAVLQRLSTAILGLTGGDVDEAKNA